MPNTENDDYAAAKDFYGADSVEDRSTTGKAPPFADMSNRYNTTLPTPDLPTRGTERAYLDWVDAQSNAVGRDVAKDTVDYDLRGWYKENGPQDLSDAHLTDKYKKPNHPTFSNQSIYHGVDGHIGGEWARQHGTLDQYEFTPGPTNYYSGRELKTYFEKVEPQNTLNLPQTREDFTVKTAQSEGFLSSLLNKVGLGEKGKTYNADQPNAYPSNEDAQSARKNEFAYGKPWESFFNNELATVVGDPSYVRSEGQTTKTINAKGSTGLSVSKVTSMPAQLVELNKPENAEIKQKVSEVFAKGALASNRDAIASLGFSPANTLLDIASNKTNIGGLYSPSTDKLWANLASDSTGSAIVHESIHRGIEQLAKTEEGKKLLKQLPDEESVVRYIMYKTMGNPEEGEGEVGDKQIKKAIDLFEKQPYSSTWSKRLDELRDLAAKTIKDKNPRGPK